MIPLTLLILPQVTNTQRIEVQNINENFELILLKIEQIKIVNQTYQKVVHIVTITAFEISQEHLGTNINILRVCVRETKR